MAEFKWTKGTPKESGEYMITVKDGEDYFVLTDVFWNGKWSLYPSEDVLAYSPLPRPFKPRKRKNNDTNRKNNNRKTNKQTKI